jgi:hypothetical protein
VFAVAACSTVNEGVRESIKNASLSLMVIRKASTT